LRDVAGPPQVCAASDGDYLSYDREIDPATAALILVDAWAIEQHANRDLMQRVDTNVRSSLLRLVKAAPGLDVRAPATSLRPPRQPFPRTTSPVGRPLR
jgi:hypothetical protein